MMAEYVEGRPIPRSSSSFTSEASLKRGGGSVKCCSELERLQRQRLPFLEFGQLVLQRLVFLVLAVLGLLVDLQEAFELQHRATHPEAVIHALAAGVDIDRRLVKDRRVHLRRHKALPDELVNLELIFLQILLDVFRAPGGRRRTNRFVRVLRVLLRLEGVGRLRQKLRAILLADQLAHLGDRVVRDARRIGTHVGDQADGSLFAQINAFIQALGDHHGALHAEAQLARGVLLELAGRKRGSRILAPLFLLDRAHRPRCALEFLFQLLRRLLVGEHVLLGIGSHQARVERRRLRARQVRIERPIFRGIERLDVALALYDQPQRDGLHAPGRQPTAHLVPKQRRHLVPDQAIQHAAGLLRVYQVAIDVAGMLKRLLHGLLRNFVKRNSLDAGGRLLGLLAVHPVAAQFFGQMGGDRLSFAVGVRSQVDGVGAFRHLLQLGDDLLFTRE